jgi:hypothetical protein
MFPASNHCRPQECLPRTDPVVSTLWLRTCQIGLTNASWAEIRISKSSMPLIKAVTLDGFPCGCLNANAGSGCSQYSSSTSRGKSMSQLLHPSSVSTRVSKRNLSTYSSAWMHRGRPTETELTRSAITSTHQTRFLDSVWTVGLLSLRSCRWKPAS